MANETKIRNGLIIEGALGNDETDRILVIDPTTGLVGYRAAIDLSTLLSTTLAQYEVIVGDSGGEATVIDSNSVGDILVDETNGLTIKAGAIVNADVNAAAAIAYSKLALTGGIVNADVNASAAIAYSKLALTGAVVNADVATAAAIARTKLASGTAYRILANNSSGVMSENAAITASRAVVADANGQLVAQADGTTAAEVGYLFGVTGPIQAQLDGLIATQTVNSVVQSPTSGEDGYAITWDDGAGEYTLTDPVAQGLPTGGTTRQWLGKNSGTNYDASWLDLVLTDITDISALAADLNLLAGADAAGITSTEIGYINGVTSPIQTQLNNKLSSALAANALFVGSGGNVAIPLVAGTEGYVLSISGGTPAWISPTAFSAEAAQDAVGGILDDGTIGEIVFTYDDSGGTISATMENAAVIGKVLTGYSSGAGTVAATDTILEAIQKLDGNIGTNYINKDIVTVSAGSLQAAGSSPVTLLSAPGSGFYYNIISVSVSYKYNSAAFNFASTESLIFHIATSTSAVYTIFYTVMNSGVSFNTVLSLKGGTVDSMDSTENQAFVLTTADGGDATTGDGDIDVVIYYTIEAVNA